ncbi:unnamed protein product [Clavelina lepadiformis]|uniref:G-protein coupled receptors family 1 profile domain-containing protein n=1 Tax=Clavelina lepadiformis TaxID=159417 RepID=A0ABP0F5F7_CLALP
MSSVNVSNNFRNNTSVVESFRYLGIAIGMFDILAGTAGNILTIVAILKNRHLCKQPFNMFIVNLSVIDLLTACFMMPFNVLGYVLMDWPFSEYACILQAFFYFCCGYTSIVCLVAITINRFVGVVFPDRYHVYFTINTVRFNLFICWLVAPALLFPFLVISLLSHANGNKPITGWNDKQLLCTFISLPQPWLAYMKIIRGIFQFLPTFLMVAGYSTMQYYVHKSNKRHLRNVKECAKYTEQILRKHSALETSRSDSMIRIEERSGPATNWEEKMTSRSLRRTFSEDNHNTRNHSHHHEKFKKSLKCRNHSAQIRRHSETHLMYLSITICSTFTLLFFPSMAINLMQNSQSFDPRVHMAASNVTWLNSCVNPIIYVILHKGMRKEYKEILKQFSAWLRRRFCMTEVKRLEN